MSLVLVIVSFGCGRTSNDAATSSAGNAGKEAEAASATARGAGRSADTDTSASFPAIFVDETSSAGLLGFTHFNGMSGEFYLCEVKSGGGGFLDYDNDGDLDLLLLQGTMLGEGKPVSDATFPPDATSPLTDRLYRNELVSSSGQSARLQFTDVTASSRIADSGYGIGMATGDINNDGWIDLYVTNFGRTQLLLNQRDGSFTDVTKASGTEDERYTTSAAFLDYDRDGWLDLFVCAYVNFNYATHKVCHAGSGRRDYCSPITFSPLPNRLYRNRGDGTFEDVSVPSQIVREYGGGLGVVCSDFNADGWPDIFVANDARPDQLWINQQDGTFRNEGLLGGCAVNRDGKATSSMGVDAADIDADGDEDLVITNLRNETNSIFINDGHALFDDRSTETGLGLPSIPYTAFGTAWIDYDNDGWLDLFVANGEVQAIEQLARAGERYPYAQRNQLFRNQGAGRFREVTQEAGAALEACQVSRGAAFGDVDNDGDVDILVCNNSGPAQLLINQVGQSHPWLGLRMIDGSTGRDLLGTRVAVYRETGPVLWRTVRTAYSYCAANDPRVLVGLGDGATVTRVVAIWPDGSQEEWTQLPINQYTTLRRGTGRPVEESR